MHIWIVDPDISTAYTLKNLLKNLPALKDIKGFKVFVFHSPEELEEALSQYHKKKRARPEIIFIEVQLPDETMGIDYYLDFIDDEPELTKTFIFYSSSSFGRFEAYFKNKGMDLPPFVSKNEIEKKLDSIILPFIKEQPEKKVNEGIKWPPPLMNVRKARFKELIEMIEKDYYGASRMERTDLKKIIDELDLLVTELGLNTVSVAIKRVIYYIEQKRTSAMRIRRELKVLMNVAEPFK